MRTCPVIAWLLRLAAMLAVPLPGRAADPLVDSAVVALDAVDRSPPARNCSPKKRFPRATRTRARLAARRAPPGRGSPEAVIARALARNGLHGERARLTREALLRNLARADAWELFGLRRQRPRPGRSANPRPSRRASTSGHLAEVPPSILPDGPAGRGAAGSLPAWCCAPTTKTRRARRAVRTRPRQPGDRLARNDPKGRARCRWCRSATTIRCR